MGSLKDRFVKREVVQSGVLYIPSGNCVTAGEVSDLENAWETQDILAASCSSLDVV